MIDLSTETVISIDQAARLIPGRGGRPMNFSTIWRWIMKGARSPSGSLVQLRAARAGAKWITSKEALQQFLEALTPNLRNAAPSISTPTNRRRAADRANRELAKMGI